MTKNTSTLRLFRVPDTAAPSPHLAHEFIRAIIENRQSAVDAKTAANWTMAGICAHESAMSDGKRIEIPQAD